MDACFQFKTSFSPCTIIQLMRYDLDALEQQIVSTIRQAPNFFLGSPLVIDLEKVKSLGILNFSKLKHILLTSGLVPVGVRGGSQEQQIAAATEGLPVVTIGKLGGSETNKKKTQEHSHTTKLITSPIRSGVQVYAKDGDLIITAAVSPGAELFSDGHIHVYGPLRGRALAGVQGNQQARIFCHTLEAELVSIAGFYLTKEEMQPYNEKKVSATKGGMIQIYLDNEQVRIDNVCQKS